MSKLVRIAVIYTDDNDQDVQVIEYLNTQRLFLSYDGDLVEYIQNECAVPYEWRFAEH